MTKLEGMPVGSAISWDNERFPFALFNEQQAQRNHYQSLRDLARRGGLSWTEAAAIIERRDWRNIPNEEAEAVVRNAAKETDNAD